MDGILIISFGTSYKEIRENTINVFVETFRESFPDIPVYLAFASKVILKKIQKEEGISIDTIEEALKRMYAEGITRVFIQSVYLFHEIKNKDQTCRIDKFKTLFPGGIYVGAPLLKEEEDYHRVFSVLLEEFCTSEDRIESNVSRETLNDTVIVLIRHAYHSNDNKAYPLNHHWIEKMGYKNIYIGAAEGYPDPDTVLALIKEKKNIRNVIMIPLFFLTGKHVLKEIAGTKNISWKNKFQQAGYQVRVVLKGIGEYPEIREYYVEHLRNIISSFNQ